MCLNGWCILIRCQPIKQGEENIITPALDIQTDLPMSEAVHINSGYMGKINYLSLHSNKFGDRVPICYTTISESKLEKNYFKDIYTELFQPLQNI